MVRNIPETYARSNDEEPILISVLITEFTYLLLKIEVVTSLAGF